MIAPKDYSIEKEQTRNFRVGNFNKAWLMLVVSINTDNVNHIGSMCQCEIIWMPFYQSPYPRWKPITPSENLRKPTIISILIDGQPKNFWPFPQAVKVIKIRKSEKLPLVWETKGDMKIKVMCYSERDSRKGTLRKSWRTMNEIWQLTTVH